MATVLKIVERPLYYMFCCLMRYLEYCWSVFIHSILIQWWLVTCQMLS